jgi:hypothetical protein
MLLFYTNVGRCVVLIMIKAIKQRTHICIKGAGLHAQRGEGVVIPYGCFHPLFGLHRWSWFWRESRRCGGDVDLILTQFEYVSSSQPPFLGSCSNKAFL